MPVLDTIITIAPMLGILGTVTGIIASFDMLGLAGVEEPKAVVAGIAQALITTAAGLGISIATVFPYNYFSARIEAAQEELEMYGFSSGWTPGKAFTVFDWLVIFLTLPVRKAAGNVYTAAWERSECSRYLKGLRRVRVRTET